jgi:ligand-binding sensor domain-containing protein
VKNLALFLVSFFIVVDSASQSSIRFKHIKTTTGEDIVSIQKFLKDKEGYVWMGSSGFDLIRFDGKNVRRYSNQELQTDYFKNAHARLIFEDSKKNLWIGTDSGALMQYDRLTDSFLLANDSSSSLQYPLFSQAEGKDGSFWLGTLGGGLIHYHSEKKDFIKYSFSSTSVNSLPDNYITGLVFDSTGKLWVGTTSGLCYYDSVGNQFIRVELPNNNSKDTYRYRVIRSMMITNKDVLYIATYGGLQIVNLNTNSKEHLIHNEENKSSLSHNSLFEIAANNDSTLWIASYGGGLSLFNQKTRNFISWKKDDSDAESISSNNLFTTYLDNTGLLWIGAADNSVCIHDTKAKKFNSIIHRANQPQGISSGWIQTIYQENDSIYWLGLNGNGLNKLNLKSGQATKFINDPKDPFSIGHNSVVAIDQDNEKRIWVGLSGGGINRLDPKTNKFSRYESGAKNSISNNAVSTMLVDRDNYIWTTTFRSGLSVYNSNKNQFININNDTLRKQTGISLAFAASSFELGENIWFKTSDQLAVYDRKKNQFTQIKIDEGSVSPATTASFLEMRPYSETEMLLITRNEIKTLRYEDPDHIEQKVILKRAANEESFKSFVMDRNNQIWYVTKDQLVKWNPQTGERRNYSQSDGITSSDLTSLYLDAQGRIFITSLNGLNWFWPNEIKDDTVSRKIVFTDFKLYNHSIGINEPDSITNYALSGHINQIKEIVLAHSLSFFSIEFSALEFMAPDKIQYAYKLNGFDKEWVQIGNQNFASYTNLDPGEYTLQVKSTNPDGFWGTQSATINIIINPPFWQTWWFISIAVLLVGGIVYSIHRYQLSQTIYVERLRNKIAGDLHDEVGSSLTRISIYSDLIQNGEDKPNQTKYLSRISEMSREIVSTMSDIVWSIDNRSDTAGALFLRMKDFATELLQSKSIQFNFSINGINETSIIDPAIRQNIYLIFKEAINNVVKHAEASQVTVEIINDTRSFKMILSDNGKGYNPNQNPKGLGLRNMERRAKSIGGTLTILQHVGTQIIFSCKSL